MSNDQIGEQNRAVVISIHATRIEAEVARSALESCGVPAVVAAKSKTKNPLLGLAGPLMDSFEIRVAADDADRAREILDTVPGEADGGADHEPE